jgi:pimeloyl-ACP methyl ester carboxylesterase
MAGMRRSSAVVLVLAGVALSACHAAAHVRFISSPGIATVDSPVDIQLHGLPSRAVTTVTASAVDEKQQVWTASARYTATIEGVVSLDQAAIGGSYTGVNPMGLFEYMLPPASAPAADVVFNPSGPTYQVTITATVKGKQVANTTLEREYPKFTVRHYRLAGSGIYADLYLPAGVMTPRPAMLLFGGSEGGLSQSFAARLLAGHGYPAMTLAYFKEPGLPSTLAKINLEYFAKALGELRAAPGVDRKHVLVYGISRGSEAALLLGAHFPKLVNGVIAGVPSSVVYGSYPDSNEPSWLLSGKALPEAPERDFDDPDPIDAQAAVIPVEQIRGPVMLICGTADTIWTSCDYAAAITKRLSQHSFSYPVTSLKYPGAGHGVGGIGRYFSATDAAFARLGGGDRRATLAGEADAYGQVLSLLNSLVGH